MTAPLTEHLSENRAGHVCKTSRRVVATPHSGLALAHWPPSLVRASGLRRAVPEKRN